MKLYVMKDCDMFLGDKSRVTRGHGVGQPLKSMCYYYLLEHEKGLTLIDLGAPAGPGFTPIEGGDPLSQLAKLGYTADDVKYVILTHMHVDHNCHMTDFPNATFIVREDELTAAWWPTEIEKSAYMFKLYVDTRNYKYIQVPGREDFDVFGDGSVVLIDTRGHSRGHQSVLLNMPNYGKILIAGDAVMLEDNLTYVLPSGTCADNMDAVRSVNKIKHYQDIGYEVFYGHEIKEYRFAPEFYD